ncbi:MAG: Tex-like N-terminal domain-containing protein, partial [Paludibacteraceae bacterium]|nr:Tex-like N-terminal domain-containing protein [Paludibacteraceae bacterium]
MKNNSFSHIISSLVAISEKQVAATIHLLDEGATIPFIARYRKEKTGSLDEVQITDIQSHYVKLQELSKRKETIYARLVELGNTDEELHKRIELCWDATKLEDIYLPYKPHRKTRADMAIERGLLPLAEEILKQRPMRLPNNEEDLQGARDIIAQRIAEDERSRNAIRREFAYSAILTTKVVKDKCESVEAQNYRDYFAIRTPLKHISSHRLLAI